jgi:hypothetical protein
VREKSNSFEYRDGGGGCGSDNTRYLSSVRLNWCAVVETVGVKRTAFVSSQIDVNAIGVYHCYQLSVFVNSRLRTTTEKINRSQRSDDCAYCLDVETTEIFASIKFLSFYNEPMNVPL